MGLYDNKLDWYDYLVPFSWAPTGHNISPFVSDEDILDSVGIGTARRQREFDASEAEKQRQYETQMSNTSYQRQSEDMSKVGLNPAMMYANSSASGASTPNGAAARSIPGNGNVANTINSASNLVRALNYDRNKSNDINLKQALKMISNVASIFK